MLELRIDVGGTVAPIYDLPSIVGSYHARREIGDQIEALINFLDDLSGDPDLEDNHDREADMSDDEDDDADTGIEDDPRGFDPEEDMCAAGDHGCGPVHLYGRVHYGSDLDEPYI